MDRTRKMYPIATTLIALSLVIPAMALADPCLVAYPTGPSVYHYDVNEYYTVNHTHPLYDPMYDRGGEVLIDINNDEIALDIYQSPNLTGFQPSIGGNEGYFLIGSNFELVIDGFNNEPTTFENVIIVIAPDPGYCTPNVTIDGNPVIDDMYPIGDLVVSTPTPYGNNYSDTIVVNVSWSGCYGVRFWAFADDDYDGVNTGGECFTAFSHDTTVPSEETSWGVIKSLYK